VHRDEIVFQIKMTDLMIFYCYMLTKNTDKTGKLPGLYLKGLNCQEIHLSNTYFCEHIELIKVSLSQSELESFVKKNYQLFCELSLSKSSLNIVNLFVKFNTCLTDTDKSNITCKFIESLFSTKLDSSIHRVAMQMLRNLEVLFSGHYDWNEICSQLITRIKSIREWEAYKYEVLVLIFMDHSNDFSTDHLHEATNYFISQLNTSNTIGEIHAKVIEKLLPQMTQTQKIGVLCRLTEKMGHHSDFLKRKFADWKLMAVFFNVYNSYQLTYVMDTLRQSQNEQKMPLPNEIIDKLLKEADRNVYFPIQGTIVTYSSPTNNLTS